MTELLVQAGVIIAIFCILTMSLNLQYGMTGLLNFGQGMFFAVGGFTVGAVHLHGWPVWTGIVLGPLLGALAGLLLALPAKVLGGDPWAFMTLAIAELFMAVLTNNAAIAGGGLGALGIAQADPLQLLGVLILVITVTGLAFRRMRRLQFGRIIRSIREDPLLVASLGRQVFHFRLIVMMIGGGVAASAGVAFAHWATFVSPGDFTLNVTLLVWAGMIIGGLGNNLGSVAGAALVQSFYVAALFIPNSPLISGEYFAIGQVLSIAIAMILILIWRPAGVLAERRLVYPSRHSATSEE